jgi:signal transduction histidine kinase
MLDAMARRRSASSLTGKLFFWATVITAATLIAVVGASTMVARTALQRQILREAELAAEDVALELYAAGDAVELIQQPSWSNKLLRRLSLRSGLRGIYIEILSNGRTSTLEASASETPIDPLIEFEEVALGFIETRTSDDMLEVVVRQSTRTGELRVRVLATTEVIGAFLSVVYRNALWMGVAAWLLLVVIIAWLIYRTVTRPLREVAAAMTLVGEGRLEQRVHASGTAEVEPLLSAFNSMSERLARTEQDRSELLEEVEELNRRLQARVEEATAALAEAQAVLARRDRLAAMGELVGTIAHEVGTPLNSVLAHLDLLGEDLPEGPHSQRLDVAVHEIERVSEIIRRYLETTRSPRPRGERVDVVELMRETAHMFESQAASRGIGLQIAARDLVLETDPDLLAQIVRNLVANSLAAVGEHGHVEIGAELDEGMLHVWVLDDGIGMDAETRRRVFEPFFTARRDGSGTGLGMPIVRNAVSSLDGRIEIDSAPGEGTRVDVWVAPWAAAPPRVGTGPALGEG